LRPEVLFDVIKIGKQNMIQENYIKQFIYDSSIEANIIDKHVDINIKNDLFDLFKNDSISQIDTVFIDYSNQIKDITNIIKKNTFNDVFDITKSSPMDGLSQKCFRYYNLQLSLERVYNILNENKLFKFIRIDKNEFDNIKFINDKSIDLSNKEDFGLSISLYKKILDALDI
jgi:hypothetical protein